MEYMRARTFLLLACAGLAGGAATALPSTASADCSNPVTCLINTVTDTVTGGLPGGTPTTPTVPDPTSLLPGQTTTQTTPTQTQTTPTQTTPSGGGQTQTQPQQPGDTRPPLFTLKAVKGQRLSTAAAKGAVQAIVTCDEPCFFAVYAMLGDGPGAKVLGVAYASAVPGTPVTFPIPLTTAGKAALAPLKSARVTYAGAGVDAAHNVSGVYVNHGTLAADPKKKKPKPHKKKKRK